MVLILHSISLLLELIFRDIHAILNSMEISQGESNTDSGSKRGVYYCRDIGTCI